MDALRIITGLVRGTSHNKLLKESGFCTLKERRRRHKLITYYKILKGNSPIYIKALLPDLVSTVDPYPRRRPSERIVPHYKTNIYKYSFFPSTTILWNSLPPDIQETQSLGQLKHYLSNTDCLVPPYYYIGNRETQVVHCRLRMGMSNLNYDLYTRHLSNDPSCACSFPNETSEHFLLHCPLYTRQRAITISSIPPHQISIQNLLHGNTLLDTETNAKIFETAQRFISLTKRFEV